MNTSLISSESTELLSRITGQKLHKQDLTPSLIFLAALITVLLGTILTDGVVTDEEKQRWQTTINQFVTTKDLRELSQLISKGVRQNYVYTKIDQLLLLTAPLSESEKLLLISFGYQMSAADGEMERREQRYLETVANKLNIQLSHQSVLASGFTHQEITDQAALQEVHFLLDSARFQALDNTFIKAASEILAVLPSLPTQKSTQSTIISYQDLKRFKEYRQQLGNVCIQLFQIVQECCDRDFLHDMTSKELEEISKKIQSQKFRLAVVGEFSQGKSTLLNALLGEEVQPVRAIPCSGSVTILKYGSQKRVICCYKDGRTEEIPLEEYKIKAAITKEAALEHRTDELVKSDIEELIFEHPELELCKNGVEIIDSPGLNEHPERTTIAQKILKNTDAAIFLTNAQRLLTEKEKELILDVRSYLNGNDDSKPAENLFILVNFMDFLDDEEDRQDVKQRLQSFVTEKNLTVTTSDRIHYISAKAALKALLNGTQDDYLLNFQNFIHSLEKFLTTERGAIQIKYFITKLNAFIQSVLSKLHLAEEALENKAKLSEQEKQQIVEQIGEASGRDVKIRISAEELIDQAIEEATLSFNQWIEELEDKIYRNSQLWQAQNNHKKKLSIEYANQFERSLFAELNNWIEQELSISILHKYVNILDQQIHQELSAIQQNIQKFDTRTGLNLSTQFNLSLSTVGFDKNLTPVDVSDEHINNFALFDGLRAGGTIATALLAFTGVGLVPIALVGGTAALVSGFLFGEDSELVKEQIKQQVIEQGITKFEASIEEIFKSICEKIELVFLNRVQAASQIIEQAILVAEELLKRQEKCYEEQQEQYQHIKFWISQKKQKIEEVKSSIEILLSQVAT